MTREEAIALLNCTATEMVGTLGEGGDVSAVNQSLRYIEALDMALSALRKQEVLTQPQDNLTQWISVEERLPKEFVSVLVYMPEERPLPTVHEGFLAREGVWYANHFDRDPMEITHWMPMPEAPKEE